MSVYHLFVVVLLSPNIVMRLGADTVSPLSFIPVEIHYIQFAISEEARQANIGKARRAALMSMKHTVTTPEPKTN